ncbi:hypothetical protein RFI_05498 [Reticulomyxa filosa]|uniref:CCT-theta n=1 Tax=Reticulomyxa filosa TaxID=46433 RepID=X6P0L9_RETFI|nr:hypothetical protein RFI_05498 [Reticulomyxa filosa]|eukprot:ETO31624.1 hypothetical protein RFI_05498 [Reticulomyxa filosa]
MWRQYLQLEANTPGKTIVTKRKKKKVKKTNMRNLTRGIPHLWKEGYKQFSGLEEAIFKNCEAATDLADVVRTSFGPNGLSKIVINRLEKVYATTDAATIINELEVQHPAAKVLCLAAAMQQQEVFLTTKHTYTQAFFTYFINFHKKEKRKEALMFFPSPLIGDGANFVVVFAGELLKNALELLRTGLHPSDLVRGYSMAEKKVEQIIKDLAVYELQADDMQDKEKLMLGIKSAISSKQLGLETFLSDLVATACLNSMPRNPKEFIVDNVRVVKILGDTVHKSYVVKGIVVESEPESATWEANDCRVAIFSCSIDTPQTESKGNVLLHNAEELLNYNKGEEENMHKIIKGMYDLGVRVLISGEKIGEMALHFIDKYKMVAMHVTSKWTLRRLCRSLKARPCVQITGVRHDDLGIVAQVRVEEIGSKTMFVDSFIYFPLKINKYIDKQTNGILWGTVLEQVKSKESPVSTIVIRGATNTVLQDIERAIDDGVNMVRAMTRNGKFVAGAGAVEIEIARRITKYATEIEGLEQYAIQQYGHSFEVVPRTLAENTGLNETEMLTKLYKAHEESSSDAHKIGIDISDGTVKDMTKEGVIDLMATRQMGIKLASQAAITLLRVDHVWLFSLSFLIHYYTQIFIFL